MQPIFTGEKGQSQGPQQKNQQSKQCSRVQHKSRFVKTRAKNKDKDRVKTNADKDKNKSSRQEQMVNTGVMSGDVKTRDEEKEEKSKELRKEQEEQTVKTRKQVGDLRKESVLKAGLAR